ncbi:MAG TPA: type I phosphomannose isomerase catalytic subunit [Ktedonobacterales bacterium]|nr:type I phosphomannose isomerase catalytic subunit [Ktedonobacterales bacterium]
MARQGLGPVQLQSSLHETIWGGEMLRTISGKPIPPGATIGESWETALDALASNAPYTGQTLEQLVWAFGVEFIGTRAAAIFGLRFPLLAKFIDARADLSVQVHPGDTYAREHEGGKLGKTECWYILHAELGASVIYGVKRHTTVEEVRRAVEETRLDELLNAFEVHAGDVIFVPAGTVHAICSGVVLYELQEYSDVTYRLYDYGRIQANGQPRELHLERGLDVMRYVPPRFERVAPLVIEETPAYRRRVLVGCRYFVEEELLLNGDMSCATLPGSCQILSVLGGACIVRSDGREMTLPLGGTAVLPASLGEYSLAGSHVRLVRSYVPEASDEALRTWRSHQPFPVED